jgi:hypothetical protein
LIDFKTAALQTAALQTTTAALQTTRVKKYKMSHVACRMSHVAAGEYQGRCLGIPPLVFIELAAALQ